VVGFLITYSGHERNRSEKVNWSGGVSAIFSSPLTVLFKHFRDACLLCGGGLQYLHRSPASRRRRRGKGNPVPGGITGPPCHWGGHKYTDLALQVCGWTQGWRLFCVKKVHEHCREQTNLAEYSKEGCGSKLFFASDDDDNDDDDDERCVRLNKFHVCLTSSSCGPTRRWILHGGWKCLETSTWQQMVVSD
jgi:hypothetical protein